MTTQRFNWIVCSNLLIILLNLQAAIAETYVYKEKDGTRWITDKPLDRKNFTFIERYGRATATKSCQGVTKKVMAARARRYISDINRYAIEFKVDPQLIKAIITVESCFDKKAISRAGARGLMQLMPATARQYGVLDRFNAQENLRAGIQHFSELLDRFKFSLPHSLAAYNAGSSNVEKYQGIPPFKETQAYVKKVLAYYKRYQPRATLADDRSRKPL